MTRAAWFEFGPFRMDVARRRLIRGDAVVPLTARTFDTLLALVERHGEMIEKETLMSAVWADTAVEESNLTQQISLLRKALGEQPNEHEYIATVPRRGYRFVAPVRIVGAGTSASARARPLVGREHERQSLRGTFAEASAGRGRMVCLAGEPGIGKTSIAEAFLAEVAAGPEPAWIARGRCSERLAGGDAYLPLLEALDSLLGAPDGDGVADRMRSVAPAWLEQLRPSPAERGAPPSQERLKREVTGFFAALASAKPGVLFIDDLQWADESTADALAYLAGRLDGIGLLILCTYRPAELASRAHPFQAVKLDLQARGICRDVAVGFLSRDDVADYLRIDLHPHRVPEGFPEIVHSRTEGNPLFLTDLVRDMRSRGILTVDDGAWMLTRPVPDVEADWPQSVRSMVERVIARVGDDELKVLAAGSVQGVEFDSVVVSRALGVDTAAVEERLERAERNHGLVRRVGESRFPSGVATMKSAFVHVLYQNALYGTLGMSRRAMLSGAVADALRELHGDQGARAAQQLAVLYAAADRAADAVKEFHAAALHALSISAAKEAVTLTRRALDVLTRVPRGAERDRQELALLITLGVPLAATTGYANPEVEQTYTRALALANALGDGPAQFAALWGLWVLYHVHGELRRAREIADQLLAAGNYSGDARVLQVAHTVSGYTIGHMGELQLALDHLRKAAEYFKPEHSAFFGSINALDPAVAAPAQEARVLWLLGDSDAALSKADDALRLARRIGNPNAIGFALVYAAYVHQMRHEPAAVLERTGQALALASEHGLADVIGWATVWRAWALAHTGGDVDAALGSMRAALAAQRSFGSEIARPHQLALVADVLILAGRRTEAIETIDEALEHAERTGDRYYDPELRRMRSQLLHGF